MKKQLSKLVFLSNSINRQHVQLVIIVLSLAMLILGIGAPGDAGGPTKGGLHGGV